jgi:hypothetical protein
LNVIGPTLEFGGRSFVNVTPAGKTSESDDTGVPAGDQLFGSSHDELTAPVHVRVTAEIGQHTNTARSSDVLRIGTRPSL